MLSSKFLGLGQITRPNIPVEASTSHEQSPGRPVWIDPYTTSVFQGLSWLNAQTVADTQSSTVAHTAHPHDADSEAAHQIKQPPHLSETADKS